MNNLTLTCLVTVNAQSCEEAQDGCTQCASGSKDRESSGGSGALRAGAFGTRGRCGSRSLRSLVLDRRGNRGRGSASGRLAGGCGGRGEDCHAQREDTEELHFVRSESVGGEVLVEWLRVVERKCDVVVVICVM